MSPIKRKKLNNSFFAVYVPNFSRMNTYRLFKFSRETNDLTNGPMLSQIYTYK